MNLEQLVSLTFWQRLQAQETLWVSWCWMGKDDEGGDGGEKTGMDTEHSRFLFSQKLNFCAPVLHVCSKVLIFFLSFFLFLVLGLVCCLIAECLFWLLEEVLTKEVEEQT